MQTSKPLLMAFLLSLFCLQIAAQRKVQMTVLEKDTEQPIVAATITYADNERLEKPQTVLTDIDGTATLSQTKKSTIYYKIAYIGFLPQTGKIAVGSDAVTLHLKEDAMKLNDVVVTGSRTARPLKLSPVSTQVLGGKDLVDAGYADLTKALQ